MNDEAAASRGPSGPSPDAPPSAADDAPTAPVTSVTGPPAEPTSAAEAGSSEPDLPAPGSPAPAPSAPGATEATGTTGATGATGGFNPPPWFGPGVGPESGPTFSRDKLVRPRQGRYVAGVCGALARATNTDPVLWRVLFAVLGVISGVGVLLYLIGWLVTPAEGDAASPIESLLGKGRSGMAPVSVVLLGGAAVLTFAFIVQDGMRASLLACAVILGAVLLIKRGGTGAQQQSTFAPPTPTGPFEPGAFDRTAEFGTVPPTAPSAPAAASPAEPVTEPIAGLTEPVVPPAPPGAPAPPPPPPPYAPGIGDDRPPAGGFPPPYAPPAGGYRPPFAPHGPYARPAPVAYAPGRAAPSTPAKPPKPPKPPRERSKLGRLTFFALIMVVGVMTAVDMAGASIAVSAYFAAALVTIGLGLVVGAWLGRARGLIALGLLASIGLLISTGAERWGSEVGNSVYRPATAAGVADRYDFTAGNATLDLRQIDFTGQDQTVTLTMKIGQMRVLLPENVDTTATLQVDNGRAVIFGQEFNDREVDGQSLTNLGPDGTGGGTLKLDLQLDTGNVEVIR